MDYASPPPRTPAAGYNEVMGSPKPAGGKDAHPFASLMVEIKPIDYYNVDAESNPEIRSAGEKLQALMKLGHQKVIEHLRKGALSDNQDIKNEYNNMKLVLLQARRSIKTFGKFCLDQHERAKDSVNENASLVSAAEAFDSMATEIVDGSHSGFPKSLEGMDAMLRTIDLRDEDAHEQLKVLFHLSSFDALLSMNHHGSKGLKIHLLKKLNHGKFHKRITVHNKRYP